MARPGVDVVGDGGQHDAAPPILSVPLHKITTVSDWNLCPSFYTPSWKPPAAGACFASELMRRFVERIDRVTTTGLSVSCVTTDVNTGALKRRTTTTAHQNLRDWIDRGATPPA